MTAKVAGAIEVPLAVITTPRIAVAAKVGNVGKVVMVQVEADCLFVDTFGPGHNLRRKSVLCLRSRVIVDGEVSDDCVHPKIYLEQALQVGKV
jgi:hypothetical protein